MKLHERLQILNAQIYMIETNLKRLGLDEQEISQIVAQTLIYDVVEDEEKESK